jgi:glycosyltransferase involved in cell wall biosynthesis
MNGGQQGESLPRTVTSLHGTDITLVRDPSYAQVVVFDRAVARRDGGVPEPETDTARALGVQKDIRVIPNFLDCGSYRRKPEEALRRRFCQESAGETLVLHVSNFRAVKRVSVVFDIFKRMREQVRARLVMIGDGPDRADLERQVAADGYTDAVDFVGEQPDPVSGSPSSICPLPAARHRVSLAWPHGERWPANGGDRFARVGGIKPEVISDSVCVTGYLQ